MKPEVLFLAAARCWERAGYFDRAAERYARADAWSDAGRCWAQAGRSVDAAAAYACAGEPISEARQWLASPWPERARRPYRQVLETEFPTAAEVEALLGLGEIELASERAFTVTPASGRSEEALFSLARIAAARGRQDLAAHAWDQVIERNPPAARKVFEDWEWAASWNRSLKWEHPQTKAPGWPSRSFRDVRLELVWEEKLGSMMYGNGGLTWSPDGRKFAGAKSAKDLVLGDTCREVRYQSVDMKAISVAFIPNSDSVLVGCQGGQVVRVDNSGAVEDIKALRMPQNVWVVAFSPRGDRVAVSSYSSPGAILRVWSWDSQGPREMLKEEKTQEGNTNPSCAWSPDGRALAWCPGPWNSETVPNNLYLFSDANSLCVSAAHKNGVNGIAFSPDGRYLVTASLDRTLVLRDAHTGEAVASSWSCAQKLATSVFHPHAALLITGGAEGLHRSAHPSCLYLLRFSQANSPHLEVLQEYATKTAVMSLAFSPAGEHLLMGTYDRLSLFRVHLI